MKLLVTGGLGFIGSNFILKLLDENHDIKILNIDAQLDGSNIKNLTSLENSPNYEFIKGNITNKKLVSNKNQWDNTNLKIEEKQIEKSKENAISREVSVSNREKWKVFLRNSLFNQSHDDAFIFEVKRIMDIVEYSSYFRDSRCMEDLQEIEKSKDFGFITKILKQIK